MDAEGHKMSTRARGPERERERGKGEQTVLVSRREEQKTAS